MNLPKLFLRRAAVAFALCAGFFLIPAGRGQSPSQIGDNRCLFIFDTSSEMKKRLPAVWAEVNALMSSNLGDQLRAGDSLGVWTFDQDLRAGQFPLRRWKPEDAAAIAASINQFVGKQHFANRTRLNALQPQLNQVIQNSGRLTVLIFCDGEDEIKWTPYDAGINRAFQQRMASQKKARQPFILVLRAQLGQYAGYTMNYADYTAGFPISLASFPEFPPLPPPPAPVKTPPPAPPPVPVVKPPSVAPPLIITGKKVETNWPPPATNPALVTPANVVPAAPTNPVASTNPIAPPPPANPVPAVQTNAVTATPAIPFTPTNSVARQNPATVPTTTNPAPVIPTSAASPPTTNFAPVTPARTVPIPPSNPTTPTNAAALPPEASSPAQKRALVIGGALLIGAVALAALAFFRRRRADHGSLISRSMRKD